MAKWKDKDWILPVTLCLVSMVMAFLICGVYMITKDNIAARAIEAQEAARKQALPRAATLQELALADGAPVDYCYEGFDAAGQSVGFVSQITVVGFGGEIEVTVGMDTAGVIAAVCVGGANFSETSGLGAKTKEPAFTEQFAGKSGTLVLKQNIDSVTGASVSSGAVVGGVNQALSYMKGLLSADSSAPVEELPLSAEELAELLPGDTVTFMGTASGIDGWWQGSTGYIVRATGYGHGPIVVTMSFTTDHVCRGIIIGDENFSEGEGYGARVLEPEFRQQFIGKSGVQSYGNGVDAVSGATSSSTGVLTAINACMSFDPANAAASANSAAESAGPEAASGESAATGEASGAMAAAVVSVPDATTEASTAATPVPTAVPTAVPTPAPTPSPTPIPTAVPAADAETSATAEATPAPTATPVPTPVPTADAVSEASVTEE